MSENTFPIFKIDAVVAYIRSDVLTGQEAKHFTKSDITPIPKPDVIRTLYMRILQLLYRLGPECYYVVPLDENMQFPLLLEMGTPIMSLYVRMCQFLPTCFVYDFQINDLLNPKAKRTIYILSGILNFLKFRNLRIEMTAEYQQTFRADLDKQQAYTKGIKDGEKMTEKLTTIPPEQQVEAKELAAALSDLQNTTTHACQEANTINQQVAEWKAEIAERSQKLTQRKVDVTTLKENIGKLKAQIVESPEELKSEMEKMKEKVKAIKNSKENVNARVVEWQIKVQAETQSKAEFQHFNKLLRDLGAGMEKMKSQQEEIQVLEAHCEAMEKEMKNLGNEKGELKWALERKMDKLTKQQIRRQRKREMKDQHVQNFMGECLQVNQKREEIVDQIQDISRETQHIKATIQGLRDVCNLDTDKAQAIYDRLLSSLDQYHKRIESHIVQGNEDIMKMKAHY
ncbi:kinetochore protein Nuf2 [Paramormyrops kingsleyae]|uniref:UF2 component of NDC80 kinetochore complex n=1 Tax=Paramormyrops kingsleyae TaxID=1676925 RepID=A0A3B3QTH0_9TELE|nr:kinetochore protein Nuf2 [Paramormyrops kingsleyae]